MEQPALPARAAALEVLTVGLPFCGFKVLSGLSLAGPGATSGARLAGAALVALGAADAAVNAANLASLLARKRRLTAACALALAARRLGPARAAEEKRLELGNSLDVLLAFVLVALMIGSGRLNAMPARRLAAWNAGVILNVLGAGLSRVGGSLRDLAR